MNHSQYFFKSSKNSDISANVWYPNAETKAVAIICHGMAEHIKRYDTFAKFLAQNGIICCGIDYPGHGDSVNERRGFFAKKDGIEYVCDCILKLKRDIINKFPDLPLILFGHSMDSFFARYIASKYPRDFDAYIFCGSSGPVNIVKFGKLLAKAEMRIKGAKHESMTLNKIVFGPYNKPFKPNRTAFDWLNSDNDAVDKYISDENCGFIFTSSGFYDLFSLLEYISSKKWFASLDKNKHYLLISGASDPLGGLGKGIVKLYNLMKKENIDNVSYKLYENMRHEILNEPNNTQVFNDILLFINQIIDSGEKSNE